MHDRILRNGLLVDGTGAAPRIVDVAMSDGVITQVGEVTGPAKEETDCSGMVVTPGFVDIHTHYDGQATWDPQLAPSCYHGVTTAVMGNCGVGFAPVHPDKHNFLIELMEGVEDIPGAALSEGIQWEWETFPEFLDALDRREFIMDIGTQVPHAAVRAYVMGQRGADNEPANAGEIARMASIVKDGMAAGALGFSTSRTLVHRALNGEPVPGTFAAEDELFGIGRVLGELDTGVFEVAGAGVSGDDLLAPLAEFDWMRRLSAEINRPVSFLILQVDGAPTQWKELLDLSADAAREGAQLYPQVAGRGFGMLTGFKTDMNFFTVCPTYQSLLELPFDERIERMRKPEVKAAILEERRNARRRTLFDEQLHRIFPLGPELNYEPTPDMGIMAMAERQGKSVEEVLFDEMMAEDGYALLLVPMFNYSDGSYDPIRQMIEHPHAVLGLGDGGAHCGFICDASLQTFMLTHWVRDRTRGDRLPLEFAVRRMTKDTANLFGLHDRGVVAPGMKADFNIIDMDALTLERPEMVYDLPAGGRRLLQKASGYKATIVSGVDVMRDGEPTGRYPGRLIRGAQDAPSASVVAAA